MKDANAPKNLTNLLKRLKGEYEIVEPPAAVDPVTRLTLGFLQWEATAAMADDAFTRLMAEMVDINELRVSHDHELLAILGEDYPLAEARIARLRESLNAIYVREYGVAMKSIAEASKKEQRQYLDSLPGMTPYVAAMVTLLSFAGHAVPVDEKLARLLVDEGVIDPGADCQHAESFLQRHILASDGLQAHLLLQAWADDAFVATPQPLAAKPKPTKKRTTKKRPATSRARKK